MGCVDVPTGTSDVHDKRVIFLTGLLNLHVRESRSFYEGNQSARPGVTFSLQGYSTCMTWDDIGARMT